MSTIRDLFQQADARAMVSEDERNSEIRRLTSSINGVAVLLKGLVKQIAARNAKSLTDPIIDTVGGHVCFGFAGAWPTPMGALVVFEPNADLFDVLRRLAPFIEAGWDIQIRVQKEKWGTQYVDDCDHSGSHYRTKVGGVEYCAKCGYQL